MKWQIPAKTFLVGEYAALAQAPAILLTTKPCFEWILQEQSESLIHPDSPAGWFWTKSGRALNAIQWQDPYQGCGGLGASSAQFIGSYIASCYLNDIPLDWEALLKSYYSHAWRGEGIKPSGYDVIAQTQRGCVYIDQKQNQLHHYDWLFKDIAFILLHTGNKLATHHHLQAINLPTTLTSLIRIVKQADKAFAETNSAKLIAAIDDYQQELTRLDLVAPTTLTLLKSFRARPEILTVKGCGALGMDVLLLIVPSDSLSKLRESFRDEKWRVLATSQDLYCGKPLLTLNSPNALADC